MASNPLESVRERLLRAGISPRHVHRYIEELCDHLTDLVARECAAGLNRAQAVARAQVILGTDEQLFEAIIREHCVAEQLQECSLHCNNQRNN